MNKNKIRKLFAVAVISGALMTGLNNAAYAVVTDYAIKVNDQLYSYNEGELKRSFLEYKRNKPAKLYEDFASKLKAGNGFYAFKDNKKGFISYKTLEKGLIEAKRDKKTFNIDKVIEKDDCKAVEINSVKEVKLNEKNEILIKDSDNTSNKNDDNKVKKEETVTGTSTTNTSKSSGGNSSRSSSRGSSSSSKSSGGSSSSKRNKEEPKKVVPEVKKEEKNELDKKVQAEKKKEEVKVQPAKEEKKPEVKENINKDVIPAVKNEEDKKVVPKKNEGVENKEEKDQVIPAANIKDKKVPSAAQGFEASIKEDSKRVVKEAEKPQAIVSKTKGNVSIKSEITQTAQKGYSAQKQITTILVEGQAKENGTIEILGQKIEIKKGDTYGTVTDKIYRKFQGDKVWDVRYRYGQWGTMGNITFHAKEFADNVGIVVNKSNENGLTYKIKNEAFGEFAIAPRKEVCTATVLNDSTANEKIKVRVHSDIVRKDFAIVEVEIKKGETKEKIAEKIGSKLKAEEEITKYFKVENKGAQVDLTQKEPYTINLSVTVVEDEIQKNDNKIQSEANKVNLQNKDNEKEKKPQVPVVKPEVKKEEAKKVVPEVKKEEKTELDKKVQPAKEKKEPVVSAAKIEEKKVPSATQGFEASIKEDSKRVVKEAKKMDDISSKTKGNLSIKSETSQTAQRGYSAQKQITTILIEGKANENGTIEILGQKIEIKKGDNPYRITAKIEKEFKDNKVWEVKYRYGQWEGKGNITFHARKFEQNVNITVNPSNLNGVIFKVKNEAFGELAIAPRKEVCTATVLSDGTVDEKVKVRVHSDIIRRDFVIVEVEIKKGETKEKIAEKIVSKLKAEEEITKYFKVENKGAQVNLTQNEPYTINLTVTVE